MDFLTFHLWTHYKRLGFLYVDLGISEELVPVIQKLGLNTIDQVKSVSANKLFNDVCGMRKKMKLKDVKNPTLEQVTQWVS